MTLGYEGKRGCLGNSQTREKSPSGLMARGRNLEGPNLMNPVVNSSDETFRFTGRISSPQKAKTNLARNLTAEEGCQLAAGRVVH